MFAASSLEQQTMFPHRVDGSKGLSAMIMSMCLYTYVSPLGRDSGAEQLESYQYSQREGRMEGQWERRGGSFVEFTEVTISLSSELSNSGRHQNNKRIEHGPNAQTVVSFLLLEVHVCSAARPHIAQRQQPHTRRHSSGFISGRAAQQLRHNELQCCHSASYSSSSSPPQVPGQRVSMATVSLLQCVRMPSVVLG